MSETIIKKIAKKQQELNDLLIEARNLNLTVELTTNYTKCINGDHVKCLGITIRDNRAIYESDGVS